MYQLENERIKIKINETGAELVSLQSKKTGLEYMWCGDKAYWGRTSPILFPVVGGCKNNSFSFQGTNYPVARHGFARDEKFELYTETKDEVWFVLSSNEETKKRYPFEFELLLGYRIMEDQVSVLWKVHNKSDEAMYFSIGGHPAFNCPIFENTSQSEYFLHFDGASTITSSGINDAGLLTTNKVDYQLKDGKLPITRDLFDKDALVIEGNQCHKVSLLTPEKVPYLSVIFDAPLFGVWAPVGGEAPFVCIEPWYGRCDREEFEGNLEEREWGNMLKAGDAFLASYLIKLE